MRLIDADTAQAGLTIIAGEQTQGKGQRGKTWEDMPTQSLLMSIVVIPEQDLNEQFLFNAATAVAITNILLNIHENWDVRIKWPNDIIINDKKAGGILIENVIRGNKWEYAIIGLGLNVLQDYFPRYLPYATSLKDASGKDFDIILLGEQIRKEVLKNLYSAPAADNIIAEYNNLLYRKDVPQVFSDGGIHWNGIIRKVNRRGQLEVQLADGSIVPYVHGSVHWKWNESVM